jgi:hypothetical protein
MKNALAALLMTLAVGAVAIPSFACGGGTSVSMFIDTKIDPPSLPPAELPTPAQGRPTLEVM